MKLYSWFFPHGEVSGSWLLVFSFPQGDLLLAQETPPGALQLSRAETLPKHNLFGFPFIFG